MDDNLDIKEDIYEFIDHIEINKENIREFVEYIHYKALLDSFTFVIESGKDTCDLSFMLTDYVEVVSKLQVIVEKLKDKYKPIENKDDKI
jgi:hypothetical protein